MKTTNLRDVIYNPSVDCLSRVVEIKPGPFAWEPLPMGPPWSAP